MNSSTSLVYPEAYGVVVVGGGHAGAEAALASARCGVSTLLVTHSVDRIGWMSCNPAIGGVGKTHLVMEIDALGGEMARNTDRAGVHYKLLNASRGPAVRAMRVQCDKLAYATALRLVLENQSNLQVVQGTVTRLWVVDGVVRGVETQHGVRYRSEAVVLTTGTFLEAVCHTGEAQEPGGRAGEGGQSDLGAQLRVAGVRTLRHKTGTCPRVDGRSVRWEELRVDPGLRPPPPMSLHSEGVILPQMDCHAANTNSRTHDLIRDVLPRSPLFSGTIVGTPPRYCPSIEDKVVRFSDRSQHPIFLEREGHSTGEVYLSGLSTSLPVDGQLEMVRSIEGLHDAHIVRFGYAVEYDTVDPAQLDRRLALTAFPGLFLAGQINGTSGYEEAAAQGLVAGLAAVALVRGTEAPVFSRADSYIGVMIDDLITRGGGEPYRMFTSRAEHRLSLRTSNADLRLTPMGRRLGLVGDAQWARFLARRDRLQLASKLLRSIQVNPTESNRARIAALGDGGLRTSATLVELLRRPKLRWEDVLAFAPGELSVSPGPFADLSRADIDELITETRYAGYIVREQQRLERTRRADAMPIPLDLDYREVGSLSTECREQLERVRPETLGQAGRVLGVTAGAVQALSVHLELQRRRSVEPPSSMT